MALTLEAWNVEKAKLVQVQDDIQSVIDAVDAVFYEDTVWDRTGVANSPTYSNGDLTVAAAGIHTLRSTVSVPLSKRYFEMTVTAHGTPGFMSLGLIQSNQSISSPPNSVASTPAGMWLWRGDSHIIHSGAYTIGGPAWSQGDTIMVAFDDSGRAWFGRNGTWFQGDPAAGTNPVFSNLSGQIGACVSFFGAVGGPVATGRFTDTAYAPPTGFALLGAA